MLSLGANIETADWYSLKVAKHPEMVKYILQQKSTEARQYGGRTFDILCWRDDRIAKVLLENINYTQDELVRASTF